MAKALQQISGLDPEVISDEQRQELLSAAQSADPKLAATADFIDGALDGEALRQAASAFQRGLNEASLRLDQAQTERLCSIRRLLYFKTITAIAACWRIIASALRKRRRLRGFKCAARGDDCGRPGVNTQDVSLFVPQSPEEIDSFIVLKSRGQEQMLSLTDGGAIITEKLAKLFDLKIGSTFTVQNSDNDPFEIRVAGIMENYAMHYVYMTPLYYEEIFDAGPEVNSQLLTYDNHDHNPEWEDQLGESLTASQRVAMVSFTSGVSDAFSDTMDSMNVVVVVLIVSAAALAFVVLYNLTNINVSERIRELSTIKVLGFYDKEVTMYIYRENMILTVLGIIAGSLGGVFLHRFVLLTAEVDAMMFSPTIHGISYGYAALLTLLFSAIVMASMHYKLKRIDMIEALKSVE